GEASGAPFLSTRDSCACGAGGKFRSGGSGTWCDVVQWFCEMFGVSRAADLYGARLEHAHGGGDRHRRLPGQAIAGRTLSNVAAEGSLDTSERRVLSRRTFCNATRRNRALQHVFGYESDRPAEVRPRRVPEIAVVIVGVAFRPP